MKTGGLNQRVFCRFYTNVFDPTCVSNSLISFSLLFKFTIISHMCKHSSSKCKIVFWENKLWNTIWYSVFIFFFQYLPLHWKKFTVYSTYQVKKKKKKKRKKPQNLLGSNKLLSVHIHLVSFINISENYVCILGRIDTVVLFLFLVFSIKSCPGVSSIGHTCIPAAQLFVLLNIYSLSTSFCIVKVESS